jgi:hypothetical protein
MYAENAEKIVEIEPESVQDIFEPLSFIDTILILK